jgi:hypothetical protein
MAFRPSLTLEHHGKSAGRLPTYRHGENRRMKLLALLFLCSIVFLAASLPMDHREPAVSADAFVDSVGVTVHLHYNDTPYGNFAPLEGSLKNLGIRHLRDALIDTTWTPFYDRLNELGKSGIKTTFVTSPKNSEALLIAFPHRVPESFEGYEAPNEYDLSQEGDWAATLNAFLAKLHSTIKSDPAMARFPIVGPSLAQPQSFSKVAASANFFDEANLHNYPGGRNPGTAGWGNNGYGSIEWNLDLAKRAWPGKPVITTEIGYMNNVSKAYGIPEEVSGKYLPRMLFEQWMHGIHRTYLYELVDLGGHFADNAFGLVHFDFSPKVGATAISNLLHLLADPGPAFRTGDLNFELSGDLTNVHHFLLEKRDGTFYLAIWIEQLSYDVDTKKVLAIPEQRVTVQTKAQVKMKAHRLDGAGQMQSSDLGAGQVQTLQVSDRLTILEFSR